MLNKSARNRFGYLAIQKGFITKDQLINAIRVQILDEGKESGSEPVGRILREMGFITDEQIDAVMKDLLESERFKCPNCGMLLRECPNCGTDLMSMF